MGLGLALRRLATGDPSPIELPAFRRLAERHQQSAVDEQFAVIVDRSIEVGWTPVDLFEVVRRKTAGPAVTHLLDQVAAATARHSVQLVHPRWLAQLRALGAEARPTAGLSPSYHWGLRSKLDWPSTFDELLAVLVVICGLPVLEPVLPAPGTRPGPASERDGIDERVLRRIRGLLAKAESSEHPDEAEALTAKAQELMTRYSIERAVTESARPSAHAPVSRRIWLASPYVGAKSLLVGVVAGANNLPSRPFYRLGLHRHRRSRSRT